MMFEDLTIDGLFVDLIIAIISAMFVVPIIFLINNYLEFNEYLRLLTKEIKDNLDLIEKLPEWIQKVRNGDRAWLPGIASNQPHEGYVLRYLSSNIYYNLINQKYWTYLNRGFAGILSELYECIEVYCKIIHKLQIHDDNFERIKRDTDDFVISDIHRIYSEERFFRDNSQFFPNLPRNSYYTTLEKTTNLIKKHSNELLKSNNINDLKDPQWWYPNWLKYLLSD
jgi:hypothetical protein